MPKWIKKDTITHIKTKWVDIFCELWIDNENKSLEYWRVEKDDSLIVLVTDKNDFLLPKRQYRVGADAETLDFPGGRFNDKKQKIETRAIEIASKELNVEKNHLVFIKQLSCKPFIINSSFNNQKLYVCLVYAKESNQDIIRYSIDDANALLQDINCLQCNFALNLYLKSETLTGEN